MKNEEFVARLNLARSIVAPIKEDMSFMASACSGAVHFKLNGLLTLLIEAESKMWEISNDLRRENKEVAEQLGGAK